MTVIEKLKQIEPTIRRIANGYHGDVIREAITELLRLENQVSQMEQRSYEVSIPGNLDSDPVQDVEIEVDESLDGKIE